MSEIRLTSLAPGGGWARKLGAADLVEVLRSLTPFPHSWVDPDTGPLEDAAVVRPPSGSPLVLTVDFITPVVDDPETFGAVAAANALSDVYAMGGAPQVALAVCGYPAERMPRDMLVRILQGGRDKAAEAGCAIVGGHTVLDSELKYGLCVVGSVDPARVFSHTHAQVGDRLVLTKPLGLGVASQALRSDRLTARDLALTVAVMTRLNRDAKEAALVAGVRAATDVTGFGLLGHLRHLLLGSQVAARLAAGAVPCLDFARGLAAEGILPGGSRRNLEYVRASTRFEPGVDEVTRALLADAQTSGGLLLAVAPERTALLLAELGRQGALAHAVVGEVVAGEPGTIEVTAAAAV